MFLLDRMPKYCLNYVKMSTFLLYGCLFVGMTMAQSPQIAACDQTQCTQCLTSSNNATEKVFLLCNRTCYCVDESFFAANQTEICGNSSISDIRSLTSVDTCNTTLVDINAKNGTGPDANTTTNATTAAVVTEAPTTPLPASTNATLLPTTSTTPTATTPTSTSTPTETTTVTPFVTTKTTPKPTDETTQPHTSPPSLPEERHFDGASFIGGIILAVGLMAIAFVGFKFYRSRTENNYHTLREAIHM